MDLTLFIKDKIYNRVQSHKERKRKEYSIKTKEYSIKTNKREKISFLIGIEFGEEEKECYKF
ncbi:hypothetical protein M1N04_00260 [Peptococcaceae bacterium]|nr:hypothetical protein [Peptococcaceae bacterium]